MTQPDKIGADKMGLDMAKADIMPLAKIMQKLRDPDNGCPWDIEQDFASIAPYTIEEAYEVADAIERSDMEELRDELGDLLLQVVFHSQMAREAGHFDLADVIRAICDKMIRRHPHVFADEAAQGSDAKDAAAVVGNWEAIKASERSAKSSDDSALAGVANALPALMRAQKLQKRAARSGFDWPDAQGPKDKISEEMAEIEAASNEDEKEEEAGDMLFAAVNYVRHLGVDAENALKRANAKFEQRFRHMEADAGTKEDFAQLPLPEKEKLWNAAKAGLKKA